MNLANNQASLDELVCKTRLALEQWLKHPDSKPLQQKFRQANQHLLEFTRQHSKNKH